MEDLCGGRPGTRVGELARHWIAATKPIDLAKAIGYSRQAGDAALDALAPAEALRYYAQALDLYALATDTDLVLGVDLAIGLGTAQRQIGDPAFRQTLLGVAHRAADLGDTERLVLAALANYRGWLSSVGNVDTDKVEVLELALDRLSGDGPDRALVLATLCSELVFGTESDRQQALGHEAVAMARAYGDDATIVRVLNIVFSPLEMSERLAWSADALVRAERLGDPVQLFLAADRRCVASYGVGDVDEMDRCLEIMGSTVEKVDQPSLRWVLTFDRATWAQVAGDAAEAEQLASAALRIGTEIGEPDVAVIFGAQFATVSLQRGTMGDLASFIEELVADSPGLHGAFGAALAVAHSEGGRLDDARELLEELALADFDVPMDTMWLTTMVAYSDAAIQCRDPRYAGPLLDRLAPLADVWSSTGVTVEGPVSHYLGGLASVLHRYDEADDYFAQSAASSERAAAKYFVARTHLLWGMMLTDRGGPEDTRKARDLLTAAHSTAVANGYGTLERRAATALRLLATET